jgi:hypothetical protein
MTERVASLRIRSGRVAIVDPIALAEALGIDDGALTHALRDVADQQAAFSSVTMDGTYHVVRKYDDDGNTSYEVIPEP